jgi:hypothetical protein
MAKKERLTTPVGLLKWAFLSEPNTRWKDDGEYKVTLTLPADHKFLKKLDELLEAGSAQVMETLKPKDKKEATLASPYSMEYDAEDNETGRVELKFKTAAFFVDKKTGNKISLKPKLFDAQGKPIKGKLVVGNGSKGAVNFSYGFYFMPTTKKVGMSMYLNAVQIIELEEYEADGSGFGFGATDGGFSRDDVSTPFDSAETEGADASEGDF